MSARYPRPGHEVVKLRDLVAPLPQVELPAVGDAEPRVARVAPFSMYMRDLAAEIDALPEGPAQDEKIRELVHLCVPDLTADEWGALAAEEALAIVAVSARRLQDVLGLLGNVPAPAADRPRRRRSR